MTKLLSFLFLLALGGATPTPAAHADEPADLETGFVHPPDSARPWTWWHWMNGCVTREGITADLEAMQRAGLGGANLFNVDQLPIDDPSVQVMNPKWDGLVTFAIQEAARLNLGFGAHNCAGWSSSGGPWVKVEQSMQKVVWTQQTFKGPGSFSNTLARPHVDAKWDYYGDIAVLAFHSQSQIDTNAIVDLSGRMSADGTLSWDAPEGEWIIARFGHTTTGKMNGPAPASGRGLECDKMSKEAVMSFWEGYPARVIADAGPLSGRTLTRMLIDSYEAETQNWTPRMREEFQKRRGYDPVPWLPVLMKKEIASLELTERFKRDWDQTISELFIDNYYGAMAELTHRHPGLEFAVEPYTGPFDTLSCGGRADMVMSEFWQKPCMWGWDSVKPVSSSGHTWGKRIIGAEAFTGWPMAAWQEDPYALKTTGDKAWCMGVNQFVLHTTAHQPWTNVGPGMTMGWWGTHFGRTQTWWEHGAPEWISYLTRSQYLLQQGLFVGDVLYLEHSLAAVQPPTGYDGDACAEDALLSRITVQNGRLVLPDGMSYRVLVLPSRRVMTPQVAQKIRQLVSDGATVAGPKPTNSPSLQDYPACDDEVARIGNEIWGESDGRKVKTNDFGKGRVYWGLPLREVLADCGTEADVVSPALANKSLMWIHRRTGSADIYLISNQRDSALEASVSFRIDGKVPELWHADTGLIEQVAVWEPVRGRTVVPLRLDPAGSVFVVFRKPSSGVDPVAIEQDGSRALPGNLVMRDGRLVLQSTAPGTYRIKTLAGSELTARVDPLPAPIVVKGAWQLHFPANSGAPETAVLKKLISWTQHTDSRVRFFSGTATYSKEIRVPSRFLAGNRAVILDLGQVKNVASVRLNGKELGVLWKPPFRLDVTSALKRGKNILEIKITNLWANRLIGDEQEPDDCSWAGVQTFNDAKPPAKVGRPLSKVPQWLLDGTPRPSRGRVAFTTYKFFNKDSPLLESGLLGPVRLETVAVQAVE